MVIPPLRAAAAPHIELTPANIGIGIAIGATTLGLLAAALLYGAGIGLIGAGSAAQQRLTR